MNLVKLISYDMMRLKPNNKLQVQFKRWNIVKGDQVIVRNGRDKDVIGKVLTVYRKSNKVKVDGVNIKIKQVIEDELVKQKSKSFPLHVSKVSLVDPEKKVATRISYGFLKDTGEKVRISKKSGMIIPKPAREELKRESRAKNRAAGMKDTIPQLVKTVTYEGENLQAIKDEFDRQIAEKERREKMLIFPW